MTKARKSALDNLLETFFSGAEANAVISILKRSEAKLSDEERDRIIDLIRQSKSEGR